MNENIVFIAKSLDGYIADQEGGIDWLNSIPNTDNVDMGYHALLERVDAVVMGRNTFEIVCSFDIPWPYAKPVYVLSTTLLEIPEKYQAYATLIKGKLTECLSQIHAKGHHKLYVDGGKTIQSFLKEDLMDELIISTIPILIGGGAPLFGDLHTPLSFEHKESKVFLNAITQDRYVRKR